MGIQVKKVIKCDGWVIEVVKTDVNIGTQIMITMMNEDEKTLTAGAKRSTFNLTQTRKKTGRKGERETIPS